MKNGIIVVDKPEGISSAGVVRRVKKALNIKKIGHTGTLDPFATGLMICGINKGTKISRFFLDSSKVYLARVCLGIETDTYDLTGQIVHQSDEKIIQSIDKGIITETVLSFHGIQKQVPPSFSALKHKGKPLYQYARNGQGIIKPARTIEIFDIKITGIELPHIDIEIHCSSGTYIRTIAQDIGQNLGCGAHLAKLKRTRTNGFSLEDSIALEDLEKLDDAAAQDTIMPLARALQFLPRQVVAQSIKEKVRFGQTLGIRDIKLLEEQSGSPTCLIDEKGELIAVIAYSKQASKYIYCCVFIT